MLDRNVGLLVSSPVITRYSGNPILTGNDIPYTDGLAYNGGVVKYEGRYVMLLRVDHADLAAKKLEGITTVALATSQDGLNWTVETQPVMDWRSQEVVAPTDVRLMLVEGRPYATVAVNTRHGMETWCVTTEDFHDFQTVFKMTPDNRDVVLFPERIGGNLLRLERPFTMFGHGQQEVFDIWTSESPDWAFWGKPQVVLDVEHVPYANLRIGPGTPPLKTERGWLLLFHAVDDDLDRPLNGWEPWSKRYTAGVMLLDLDDPRRVIGLSRQPLLAPEAPYEREGYRGSVIFPCGWVLEDDGEVKIYYGAADTVQCLATAHLDDLLNLCQRTAGM